MIFDGIIVANLVRDVKEKLEGGKINKIVQPEKNELLITIKNSKETLRLLVSTSASLPLIYFAEDSKPSPMTASNFCILLHKHIRTGHILKVSQPGLEQIIQLEIEHLGELGDLCRKLLIVELMGKHSSIIFCKEDGTIIDSIKHIPAQVGSVREVLPGRTYFIPHTMDKANPLEVTEEEFKALIGGTLTPIQKALYLKLAGINPVIGGELYHLTSTDGDRPANGLSETGLVHLYHTFSLMMEDVADGNFTPSIITRQEESVEFTSVLLACFDNGDYEARGSDSVSQLLETYYVSKNTITRIRQESVDLRKIVQAALGRNYKKYDLQARQLRDTEKRDKYKVYRELLDTYGYELAGGEKGLKCLNYYTNEEITIPLDTRLSARENTQKNFDKYNKLERTFRALSELTEETKHEIEHLGSINTALNTASKRDGLVQIREELTECGYIKRRHTEGKKVKITSRPSHYFSSNGFHIYAGKNNYQDEELTFRVASGNDWWFHAKGISGSHVIVKTEEKELSNRVFEEAGALTAYCSKGRDNEKMRIDHIQRKHVKKVTGGAPGFVIYHTNYPLMAELKLELSEA